MLTKHIVMPIMQLDWKDDLEPPLAWLHVRRTADI